MVRGAEDRGGLCRSSGRDRPRYWRRLFLLRLPESTETEAVPYLAELRGRRRGRLLRLSTKTEGIFDLAEFRGGQGACSLDQVVPGHRGQPRARGKARAREREPKHAFKGQSFH